jgi:copper homeostasis protein
LIREACVETAQQALLAEQNGADRIELCAHLEWDGLTPTEELLNDTLSLITIPIMAMVRSRKGDFVYSKDEMQEMIRSMAFLEKAGVHGIVFGSLLKNNEIDLDALHQISSAAPNLPLTFHKAIDYTSDPLHSLKLLAKEKVVSTVLTSGGIGSAWENREILKKMVEFGKNHNMTVLVAGGVRHDNLAELHAFLNATAYHGRKIVGDL